MDNQNGGLLRSPHEGQHSTTEEEAMIAAAAEGLASAVMLGNDEPPQEAQGAGGDNYGLSYGAESSNEGGHSPTEQQPSAAIEQQPMSSNVAASPSPNSAEQPVVQQLQQENDQQAQQPQQQQQGQGGGGFVVHQTSFQQGPQLVMNQEQQQQLLMVQQQQQQQQMWQQQLQMQLVQQQQQLLQQQHMLLQQENPDQQQLQVLQQQQQQLLQLQYQQQYQMVYYQPPQAYNQQYQQQQQAVQQQAVVTQQQHQSSAFSPPGPANAMFGAHASSVNPHAARWGQEQQEQDDSHGTVTVNMVGGKEADDELAKNDSRKVSRCDKDVEDPTTDRDRKRSDVGSVKSRPGRENSKNPSQSVDADSDMGGSSCADPQFEDAAKRHMKRLGGNAAGVDGIQLPKNYYLPQLPVSVELLQANQPLAQKGWSMFFELPALETEFLQWRYSSTHPFFYGAIFIGVILVQVFIMVSTQRYLYYTPPLVFCVLWLLFVTLRYVKRLTLPCRCAATKPPPAAGHEMLLLGIMMFTVVYNYLLAANTMNTCVEKSGERFMLNYGIEDHEQAESRYYCSHMVATTHIFAIFLPIIVAQPRYFYCIIYWTIGLVCFLVSPVVMIEHSRVVSLEDYYGSVGVVFPAFFFCAVYRYFEERRLRTEFQAIGELHLSVIRIHEAKEARRRYVEELFPPLVRKKLFSSRIYTVDRAKEATCVMVDIADFPIWCTQRLPRDAAIVAGAVGDILTQESLKADITTIYSSGDVFCGCCNLLDTKSHHALRAVYFAIKSYSQMFQLQMMFRAAVSLRCAIHTGHMYGDVIGETHLRYSVFGPTHRTGNALLAACSPQVILASEATHNSYGSYVEDQPAASVEVPGKRPLVCFEVINLANGVDVDALFAAPPALTSNNNSHATNPGLQTGAQLSATNIVEFDVVGGASSDPASLQLQQQEMSGRDSSPQTPLATSQPTEEHLVDQNFGSPLSFATANPTTTPKPQSEQQQKANEPTVGTDGTDTLMKYLAGPDSTGFEAIQLVFEQLSTRGLPCFLKFTTLKVERAYVHFSMVHDALFIALLQGFTLLYCIFVYLMAQFDHRIHSIDDMDKLRPHSDYSSDQLVVVMIFLCATSGVIGCGISAYYYWYVQATDPTGGFNSLRTLIEDGSDDDDDDVDDTLSCKGKMRKNHKKRKKSDAHDTPNSSTEERELEAVGPVNEKSSGESAQDHSVGAKNTEATTTAVTDGEGSHPLADGSVSPSSGRMSPVNRSSGTQDTSTHSKGSAALQPRALPAHRGFSAMNPFLSLSARRSSQDALDIDSNLGSDEDEGDDDVHGVRRGASRHQHVTNVVRKGLIISGICRSIAFLVLLGLMRPATQANGAQWVVPLFVYGFHHLLNNALAYIIIAIAHFAVAEATQLITGLPIITQSYHMFELLYIFIFAWMFYKRVTNTAEYFRYIKVQESFTEVLHEEEATREKVLLAVIPEAMQPAAMEGRHKNTLEVSNLNDLVIMAIRFDEEPLVGGMGGGGSFMRSSRTYLKRNVAVFETALTMLCPASVAVVNALGDTLMIAGPLLTDSSENRDDAETSRITITAAVSLLKTLCYMKQKKIPFTAVMTFEMGFGVLSNARFPKYDVLGVAVYTARALLAAAPMSAVVATNKLQHFLKVVKPTVNHAGGNSSHLLSSANGSIEGSGIAAPSFSAFNQAMGSASTSFADAIMFAGSGADSSRASAPGVNRMQNLAMAIPGSSSPPLSASPSANASSNAISTVAGAPSSLNHLAASASNHASSMNGVVTELNDVIRQEKGSRGDHFVLSTRPFFGKLETWRIRGIGAVGVHQVQFKRDLGAASNAHGSSVGSTHPHRMDSSHSNPTTMLPYTPVTQETDTHGDSSVFSTTEITPPGSKSVNMHTKKHRSASAAELRYAQNRPESRSQHVSAEEPDDHEYQNKNNSPLHFNGF